MPPPPAPKKKAVAAVAAVAEGGDAAMADVEEAKEEAKEEVKEEVAVALLPPGGNGLAWPDRSKVVARLLMLGKLVSGREEQVCNHVLAALCTAV
jgi:hypothetical protein